MNRRTFITTTAGAVSGFFLQGPRSLSAQNRRKRIAALSTTYHVRSHSDNFITRFLEGWWINDTYHKPPCDVASLFVEQEHDADIGNRLARSWGIRKVPTIREALTLGGDKLDVDGVLLIGEHGNYPTNVKNQKLYPRYRFMDQVVSVFKHSRRAVPVFNDKHLSYDPKNGSCQIASVTQEVLPRILPPRKWRKIQLRIRRQRCAWVNCSAVARTRARNALASCKAAFI